MKQPQAPELIPRSPRMPLFVPVATEPALAECWSVNISSGGIGIAMRGAGVPPLEGDALDTEFALPDLGTTVRAQGVVAWRQEEQDGTWAVGVRFTQVPPRDRLDLTRYLQDYRFHVGVAFAVSLERDVIEAALSEHTRLHFADSITELSEVLSRGDVAVILACGSDARLLEVAVKTAAEGNTDQGPPHLHGDLVPRVVHVGAVSPEHLVRHFNSGRLHNALRPPVAAELLRRVVLGACEDYGRSTEMRRMAQSLERALLRERARARPESGLERIAERLVYEGRAMEEVMRLVRMVAPHKVGVLLHGETGTGKEILARTIHDLSERANEAFVIQDCGVLTETLLESELFGHVKGAFTGATADHPGLFLLADGGTIFLDEIENTSPNFQAKLLRVIETGSIRPVGSTQTRKVDVRIVVATNRDLTAAVDQGRFRADLFFRLNTFTVDVPPLRARRADVLPLARHFVGLANESLGRSAVGLSSEAEAALMRHPWPGNVRELRNVIERAVLLSGPSALIGLDELPAALNRGDPTRAPLRLQTRLDEVERDILRETLDRHDGVLRRAARELGVSPVTLGRKAKKHGLHPAESGEL